MKTVNISMILAVMMLLAATSCKKEFEPTAEPADLLQVDFTGEWNAYGYMNFSGPMPLETVKIERKNPGSTYYIATKIKGDDAVPGGVATWYGDINSRQFTTTCVLGNGNGTYFEDPNVEFEIIDQNTIKNIRYKVMYIRRVVEHF